MEQKKTFGEDYKRTKQITRDENIKLYEVIKRSEKNQQIKTPYISMHIRNMKLQQSDFLRLLQFRFLNIIPYDDYYFENEEHKLVYKNYLQYILKPEQINDQMAKRLALQLALTYAEMKVRGYHWPLKNIDQLYYYKDLMYLSLIEYDFENCQEQISQLDTFRRFAEQYFIKFIPELQSVISQDSFPPIVEFLLKINGNLHQKNHIQGLYENVLTHLFHVDEFDTIYDMNQSVVKYFKKPENFIQADLNDELLVYKTCRNNQEEKDSQLNLQREIEFLERFYKNQHLVAGFAYFRVQGIWFLFMRKYCATLEQKFEEWNSQQQTEEKFIQGILQISFRFAYSLLNLQNMNIMHRDLKPQNLFLDNQELKLSNIFIGDFGRSKSLQNLQNNVMTIANQINTYQYDAPETQPSLKYNIFQYGMVTLTMANKGQYVGNQQLGCRDLREDEFNSYYSKESLQKILQHTNYPNDFILLISECLQRIPEHRPQIEVVYCRIRKLYQSTTIKSQGNIQDN